MSWLQIGTRHQQPLCRLIMTSSPSHRITHYAWWRHQMETFPRHWPFVKGIHRSPVDSPHKVQWHSFSVFFDLPQNKRLSKQSKHRWFETPWRSLWCYCNGKNGKKSEKFFTCLDHAWCISEVYQQAFPPIPTETRSFHICPVLPDHLVLAEWTPINLLIFPQSPDILISGKVYKKRYFVVNAWDLSPRNRYPDSKVLGANMGPIWVLSAPDGPLVGPWTLLSGYLRQDWVNSLPGILLDVITFPCHWYMF